MKAMAKRLKRLEVRIRPGRSDDLTDEAALARAASLLCGISLSNLRDLQTEQTDPRGHDALTDRQRLALAIVSGETEAMNAVLKVGRDATSRNAKAIEEIFARVYEEWQHMRAAQLARGGKIGDQADWLFEDRKFGSSPS